MYNARAVASGGAGGALAPSVFAITVNPISTRGADYAHHSTTSPPDFQTLQRPCSGCYCEKGMCLTNKTKKIGSKNFPFGGHFRLISTSKNST